MFVAVIMMRSYDDRHGEVDDEEAEAGTDFDEESSEEENTFVHPQQAFQALLKSLKADASAEEPRKKKRKFHHERVTEVKEADSAPPPQADALDETDLNEPQETDSEEDLSDDDEEDNSDPFETHFNKPDEAELSRKIKEVTDNKWHSQTLPVSGKAKFTLTIPGSNQIKPSKRIVRTVADLKLKKRLVSKAKENLSVFENLEQDIIPVIFNYQDLMYGARTPSNAERLRQIVCLHALNHIFKTRDRVIKNNEKIAKEPDMTLELRDQGFTRPKVLFLLETRNSCAKMIDALIALCNPEQQENKKRFHDSFVDEQHVLPDRPPDFRDIFEGNSDGEFRLGLKFTRKTIKFFSPFYTSDIIFASPLGLRRILEHDDPKKRDYDFLNSIEILILDQVDAMFMQNPEHIEFVLSHLNLQPKELHGADLGRVRNFYLDGHAEYLRQSILLSAYLTPRICSLSTRFMKNVDGKARYEPAYDGAIEMIGLGIKQTFGRFASTDPISEPDKRFKYFTSTIVPSLAAASKASTATTNGDGSGGQGILIYIPDSLDFIRVRNFFATSTATQNISFGAISEYTAPADVRRCRAHFLSGRYSVLLYTQRVHHFRRYNIKGTKKVVLYGVPDNPIFYSEIVSGFLGQSIREGRVSLEDAGVRCCFSRLDKLALERVVGTERVGALVENKGGDTFVFT
jgi:U3 small nucleolar RNA-associated protein 25